MGREMLLFRGGNHALLARNESLSAEMNSTGGRKCRYRVPNRTNG